MKPKKQIMGFLYTKIETYLWEYKPISSCSHKTVNILLLSIWTVLSNKTQVAKNGVSFRIKYET